MTYIPLHHKYRPQTFAQLVGQEAIATTLSNALTQNRIAPAYLFTGARGTGKTSSARIFAKSLNCIQGDRPTPAPCGVCEVCQEVTRGNALDVIEIDAASNTGVDSIRELIERSQFAPVKCRYKVYIIDECHMLTSAAFNALLKTLEEPPDRVIFVLATTDPQRVLPTIISRCQRFDFRRIPLEAMVQHLTAIAHQETIAIAPDALQLISQISQGGLRDAESLLDQLSLSPETVTVDKVWDLVGAVPERDLLALTRAIASDNPELLLDQSRKLMDRGREPLIVLQNLASFYRDLLIAKTSPQRNDLVAITAPTWAEMIDFVRSASLPWLLQGQQHLRSAEVQVKNTTQPRLWLEITLMGLLPSTTAAAIAPVSVGSVSPASVSPGSVSPGSVSPIANPTKSAASRSQPPIPTQPNIPARSPAPEVQQQPATPTPIPAPAPIPAAAPVPVPIPTSVPAAVPAAVPTAVPAAAEPEPVLQPEAQIDLTALWQEILANVEEIPARAILSTNCSIVELNGKEIKIGVHQKSSFNLVKQRSPQLGKACAKTLKGNVKLSLVVIEGKAPAVQPMPLAEPRYPSFTAPANPPPSNHPSTHPATNSPTTSYPVGSAPIAPIAPSKPIAINPMRDRTESIVPSDQASSPSTAKPFDSPLNSAPNSPTPQTDQASSANAAAIDDFQLTHRETWDIDDLTKASKSLAAAFDGVIINLDETAAGLPLEISQALTPTSSALPSSIPLPTIDEIMGSDRYDPDEEDDTDTPF